MKYETTRIYTVEFTQIGNADSVLSQAERKETGEALEKLLKAASGFAETIAKNFQGFDDIKVVKVQDFSREVQ